MVKICNKDAIIHLLQKSLLHPRVPLRIPVLNHSQIHMVCPCFASHIECLAFCSPKYSPCQLLRLPMREVGREGVKVCCDGAACMALHGLFSRAGLTAWWTGRAAQERLGVSDWISVRVLQCGSSGVCCQSGEKWSRRADCLQGLFRETYL